MVIPNRYRRNSISWGNVFEVSRKKRKKTKVVTGNGPNMNEPTTTTVNDLQKKGNEKRPCALRSTAQLAAQSATEQDEPAPRGLRCAILVEFVLPPC